ncbi:hypothetical protein OF83DRAFT_1179622 [Amylostereum chailletii]|nr:hypothetical protein OF83DRAFT_1179622 [Amylostereum chailletii]
MASAPPTVDVLPPAPLIVPLGSAGAVNVTNSRWLARGVVLFDNIDDILRVGSRLDAAQSKGVPDGLSIDLSLYRKQRYLDQYTSICATVSKLREFIQADPDDIAIKWMVAKIIKGSQNGRAEDTSKLRDMIPGCIARAMECPLEPWVGHAKGMRGVNHPVLACFLCPAHDIERYDVDPFEGRKMLRDGRIKMNPTRLPIGFYKDFKYDPGHPDDGLLESDVLLQAAQLIFTGKSTLDKGTPPDGARGILKRFGIKKVNSHMIAYIGTQVRFSASSSETWTQHEPLDKEATAAPGVKAIKAYSQKMLFDSIISIIDEDPDDEVSRRIQRTWNLHLFGDPGGIEGGDTTDEAADSESEDEEWNATVARRGARSTARYRARATATPLSAATPTTPERTPSPAPPVIDEPVAAPPAAVIPRQRRAQPVVPVDPAFIAQSNGGGSIEVRADSPLSDVPLTPQASLAAVPRPSTRGNPNGSKHALNHPAVSTQGPSKKQKVTVAKGPAKKWGRVSKALATREIPDHAWIPPTIMADFTIMVDFGHDGEISRCSD